MALEHDPKTVEITVKFGRRSIPISVDSDATVKDLKSIIHPLTDVLPRGQKLIARGKLLEDNWTIRQAQLINGANVMLIASHGLHQGSGPTQNIISTSRQRTEANSKSVVDRKEVALDKDSFSRWKSTGVFALSQSNLKAIPPEVWDYGASIRVFDINNNFVKDLPIQIGRLIALQKLYLDNNCLSTESVNWEALTSLKHLTIFSASHNSFTCIPTGLGSIGSLKHLNIAHNKLTEIPADIGLLTQLEILNASNNRVASLPESIGDCISLVDVDLSSNVLTTLPNTFDKLTNMMSLHLSNNGLKSVPQRLFKMCENLSTLNLHNTEVTIDMLRQYEGWEEFDKRRLSKHQRQLDFRVVGCEEFDEGADKL